jgi:CNT family concentrative nucleoside transporter
MIFLAWLMSSHRTRFPWRIVVAGTLLQMIFALLILKTKPGLWIFQTTGDFFTQVQSFVDAGSGMVFGKGYEEHYIAFRVLPTIIFFSALMAVMYHLGIMQIVVRLISRIMQVSLRISGAESLSAAANIFVGQTEAPLVVRPYIGKMTRSELMSIMVGGFATIAGSVMAAYIGMVGGEDEASRVEVAKHFMTACVMSAPAAIVMAKLMLPETEPIPDESPDALRSMPRTTSNLMDAAAEGASDGLRLALNVGGMLIAFVSLIALVNWPLAALGEVDASWLPIASWRAEHGIAPPTLQNLLGWLLQPMAWLMGCGADSHRVASLMGTQVIATEFVAYVDLAQMVKDGSIAGRGATIATFALCGFANLPSIAIQIGGLGAMAPERRSDFARIGFRAMCAGALACWMTGAMAGVIAP